MTPRYIAIEGIDGAGKDTQIALLAQWLDRAGITPIVLHEPSHGPHGRRIRAGLAMLTDNVDEQRALFTADRIDHVATKIEPALSLVRLNPGFALLQNRSLLSAAAYQPLHDSEEGLRDTIEAERQIAPMPDMILILDLSPEVAMKRIAAAGSADSLERLEVLSAARQRYLRLARVMPECVLVDASAHPAIVAKHILAAIGVVVQDAGNRDS